MATNLLNRLAPIFISHGSPNLYMDTLSESFAFYRNLGKSYLERTPRIEAVVIFSAHWDTSDSIHVTTSAKHNQIYDFYNFPKEMYQFKYPARGHPKVAEEVISLLKEKGIKVTGDPLRGLDHGAWSPLSIMFPNAEIPIVQVSLNSSFDANLHIKVGEALAPLQYKNILIMGSGAATHNLREIEFLHSGGSTSAPDSWATGFLREFEGFLKSSTPNNIQQLSKLYQLPYRARAHPTLEHLCPVLIPAAAAKGNANKIHDAMMFKNLSMATYTF